MVPGGFFYARIIQAVKYDKIQVQFDDGDQATVTAKQITPLDIKVGSRVFGRGKGGPAYFPGKVDEQKGKKIHIKYDDGDQEWTTISMVRVERL